MPAAAGDQQLPRPQEVFISYSRKDNEFVGRPYQALQGRDREVWLNWAWRCFSACNYRYRHALV